MNKKTRIKPLFQVCCRFMSGFLTLTPRKTYVYVFRALFGFCNYHATSCFLQKLGTYSFGSTLNPALNPTLKAVCVHALVSFPQFTKIGILILVLFIPKKLLLLLLLLPLTATTATNNKAHAYSGSCPVIQIEETRLVYANSGPGLLIKLQAKAGKYKLGARAGKYKLDARAVKYKLEFTAVKCKLRTTTGGWSCGPGPGAWQVTGDRKIQTLLFLIYAMCQYLILLSVIFEIFFICF